MKIYNLYWKISINDRKEYIGCAITPWHESWCNEVGLCRRLYCTEEEAKLLINSSPVFLLDVFSFILTFIIPWMSSYMNQVNGVLVQKKDWDSCTMNLDGHCFNVQTSTKLMRVFGQVSHSFSSKTKCSIRGSIEEGWWWSNGTTWLKMLYFWWK